MGGGAAGGDRRSARHAAWECLVDIGAVLQLKVLHAAGWHPPITRPPRRPSLAPAAAWSKLRGADGILVPGGFGGRGIEGGCLALPCCDVRCSSQQPCSKLVCFAL